MEVVGASEGAVGEEVGGGGRVGLIVVGIGSQCANGDIGAYASTYPELHWTQVVCVGPVQKLCRQFAIGVVHGTQFVPSSYSPLILHTLHASP